MASYELQGIGECHQEFLGDIGFVNATSQGIPIEWLSKLDEIALAALG